MIVVRIRAPRFVPSPASRRGHCARPRGWYIRRISGLPPVDKFPYQTRRMALALPLRVLCLLAALARPSSIWNTWSAPRIAISHVCMPCARAPAPISIRVPGVRAGGGDVEAQSDRTPRPSRWRLDRGRWAYRGPTRLHNCIHVSHVCM